MTKKEFIKAIEEIPKVETSSCISSYNSINVDDLKEAVDRFNKIPNYNDLLKENQELKLLNKTKDIRNSRQRVDNKKLIEQNYKIIRENVSLKQQLKQRDKVIDESINQTKFIDEQLRKYVTPIPSKEVTDLLEILQKYKGEKDDNK